MEIISRLYLKTPTDLYVILESATHKLSTGNGIILKNNTTEQEKLVRIVPKIKIKTLEI